jgi:hypothetical protein
VRGAALPSLLQRDPNETELECETAHAREITRAYRRSISCSTLCPGRRGSECVQIVRVQPVPATALDLEKLHPPSQYDKRFLFTKFGCNVLSVEHRIPA